MKHSEISKSSHVDLSFVLLEPNLALMDISCRQFHNEKRHCAQKHLSFSCTLTILLGALYLWHFMNESMTVHAVADLLYSLLTSVLAVASLCAGNGLHLEQRVVTTLQESRSSQHCQRPPHAFRGQKPLCCGFPLVSGSGSMPGLWGCFEGLCQAKEPLSGVAPSRGCVPMLSVLFCA